MRLALLALLLLGERTRSLDNGMGDRPMMGWNSWNVAGCDGVNEELLVSTMESLVSSGVAAAGYTYVGIDDCWQLEERDGEGNVRVDESKFPRGMTFLAEKAHSLGLKFGLYSSAGTRTCAGRAGSLGYEEIDAQTYASWGVDLLKYDNCYYEPETWPQSLARFSERYRRMGDALNATGRPIYYALCEWGVLSPWEWGAEVANSWRTTQDVKGDFGSILRVAGKLLTSHPRR